MNDTNLTLLTQNQIWGNNGEQLEIFKKYDTRTFISDLAILTGCFIDIYYNQDGNSKGKPGSCLTNSINNDYVIVTNFKGLPSKVHLDSRYSAIRPILQSNAITEGLIKSATQDCNGIYEVEYGEYPQYAVPNQLQILLEYKFCHNTLNKTNKNYTFDLAKYNEPNVNFVESKYAEYEYKEKKYIRMIANSDFEENVKFKLSNGMEYKNGDVVWLEVMPVKWLIDTNTNTLISKIGLISGIRYLDLEQYLNKYMCNNLFKYNINFKNNKEDDCGNSKDCVIIQFKKTNKTY